MSGTNPAQKIEKIVLDKLPLKPETVSFPEKPAGLKKQAEAVPDKIKRTEEAVRTGENIGENQPAVVSPQTGYLQKRAEEIDHILADGLNDMFLKMPPKEQTEFKKKGEETVVRINDLLGRARVNVNKIISLIKQWLRLIPGINKFFLEQEAKIKADKILNIKNKF